MIGDDRDKISAWLGIIISFQANGTAVVFLRVEFGHGILSSASHLAEPADGGMTPPRLVFSRKFLMDPEKLVAFVQHADETAETRVFGFEQGVEFA